MRSTLTCRPFKDFLASASSSLDWYVAGPDVVAMFKNFSHMIRLVASDRESYLMASVILLLMASSKL